MKTVAINSDDFITYGCPCCCKFEVEFLQFFPRVRVLKCKRTHNLFHVVVGRKRKTSPITTSNGHIVRVVKHPLGQM